MKLPGAAKKNPGPPVPGVSPKQPRASFYI
jgi:hypothetical protein